MIPINGLLRSLSDSYFGLAGSLDAIQMLEDRRQTTSPHDVEERSSHSRIGIVDQRKLEVGQEVWTSKSRGK